MMELSNTKITLFIYAHSLYLHLIITQHKENVIEHSHVPLSTVVFPSLSTNFRDLLSLLRLYNKIYNFRKYL